MKGDDGIKETFGERLRRVRESQGWSQRDLANLLGISLEVVRSWETGTGTGTFPDTNQILKIEKALKVAGEWLIAGDSVLRERLRLIVNGEAQRRQVSPSQRETVLRSLLDLVRRRVVQVAPPPDWVAGLERLVAAEFDRLQPQPAKLPESDTGLAPPQSRALGECHTGADFCTQCGTPFGGGARCPTCGMFQGGHGPDQ